MEEEHGGGEQSLGNVGQTKENNKLFFLVAQDVACFTFRRTIFKPSVYHMELLVEKQARIKLSYRYFGLSVLIVIFQRPHLSFVDRDWCRRPV
jgi:hypothetical protein